MKKKMQSDNDKTESFVPLTKGTQVGRYTIVEKIGAGGMGEVYLAEDTELDRKVALKFLPYQFLSDENAKARFKREAQATAKLSHPNIVHIYEVSEYKGRPFFAMECCDGKSLRDTIKEKELSIEETINLAVQICEGLAKAHQAGIVHRDIKPSNIIIDSDGRAKLLDFGLATVQGTEKLTQTGSTLGTVGYMSPEQIRIKEIDHRSDLFSLGVVLYEMLTGRLPFKGDTDAATLNSILNDTPEPLSRYKSNVPERLEQIVSKLLEKNPEHRYQSAAGILSDLKRLSSKSVQPEKMKGNWNRYVVVAAVIIIMIFSGYWFFLKPYVFTSYSIAPERKMLAVLPFENLGDPEDEYFADGMTEEIISRLTAVRGVGVISRTSVYKYKDEKKTIPEIAEELGVQYILEGTVRWEKAAAQDRIRVTPQLIDVASDAHLWSNRYDRSLTSVFEVQGEIASQVVAALGMTLGSEERNQVEHRPTNNMAAYDAYIRAKEFSIYYPEEVKVRIDLFKQAIELDSGFIDAYGQLASDCIWMVRLGQDKDGSLLETAEDVLNIVGKSAPNNPIYLLAKCNYEYYINLNYDGALIYCQQSLDRLPNNVEALSQKAAILRRQGKWQESLRIRRQAVELDPRDELWEYSNTLWCLRQLDSAMAALDRLLFLEPDHGFGTRSKAELLISWKGDFGAARDVMEKAIQTYGQVPGHSAQLAYIDICLGDYERALGLLAVPVLGQQLDLEYHYLLKGMAYQLAGDTNSSHFMYDSALAYVDSYSAEGTPMAESIRLAERALALSGLGRHDEAVHSAKQAARMLPVERDHNDGPEVLLYVARVYASAGMTNEALDVVQYLLSIPCELTVPDLKYRPEWAHIRDHPCFQALIEKYEKRQGI